MTRPKRKATAARLTRRAQRAGVLGHVVWSSWGGWALWRKATGRHVALGRSVREARRAIGQLERLRMEAA